MFSVQGFGDAGYLDLEFVVIAGNGGKDVAGHENPRAGLDSGAIHSLDNVEKQILIRAEGIVRQHGSHCAAISQDDGILAAGNHCRQQNQHGGKVYGDFHKIT